MKQLLYKIELICLKFIPYLLTLLYVIHTILMKFGIYSQILSTLCSMSVLPLIFIWISSYTFKFCWKHRLPIYYITAITLFNYITLLFNITTLVYNIAFWIFLIVGIIILAVGFSNLLKNHVRVNKMMRI